MLYLLLLLFSHNLKAAGILETLGLYKPAPTQTTTEWLSSWASWGTKEKEKTAFTTLLEIFQDPTTLKAATIAMEYGGANGLGSMIYDYLIKQKLSPDSAQGISAMCVTLVSKVGLVIPSVTGIINYFTSWNNPSPALPVQNRLVPGYQPVNINLVNTGIVAPSTQQPMTQEQILFKQQAYNAYQEQLQNGYTTLPFNVWLDRLQSQQYNKASSAPQYQVTNDPRDGIPTNVRSAF